MAQDIFARTVLLLAGRVQRIARDEVKTSALDECRRPRHLGRTRHVSLPGRRLGCATS